MKFKACAVALNRSLLEVNEDLKDKHNAEVRFLVHLQLYVNNFFVLKILFAIIGADVNYLAAVLELLCLGCHVTAFEADYSVWQGIELLA